MRSEEERLECDPIRVFQVTDSDESDEDLLHDFFEFSWNSCVRDRLKIFGKQFLSENKH